MTSTNPFDYLEQLPCSLNGKKKKLKPLPDGSYDFDSPESVDIDVNISRESLVVSGESVMKRKEETQHRYYQNFIKRVAEAREYKATIEAPTPDGSGRVDI